MASERIRIEIAFTGGQVVAALVEAPNLDAFQQALRSGDGVFELATDDGNYFVPVARVVYVRRFARETHIGFGGVS